MARKLTVTLPDGTTTTRRTDRTYTHVIAAFRSHETLVADAEDDLARRRSSAAAAAASVDSPSEWDAKSREIRAEWAETSARNVEKAEARLAEARAKVAGEWVVLTWCGRPDLATKALASKQFAYWSTKRIVPVNA